MDIGKTLYVTNRKQWRTWLSRHHASSKEIWLIYYKKLSGKKRIPYNDAVEEALCYGWIDSILKPIDDKCFAQRYSPRRPGSALSEMNKERVRRLVEKGLMRKPGLESIRHHMEKLPGGTSSTSRLKTFRFPSDILKRLKSDPEVWKNFSKFPDTYKRIRVGWIDASRHRPEIFAQRLGYFMRMTAKNRRFGMVQ